MTVRTTVNHDGTMTTTTHGHASSTQYKQEGYEVQRGMGSVTVATPDLLQDTDLITIDGIQMPVLTAREFGFVNTTPGAAQTTQPKYEAEADDSKPQRSSTGHAGYDEIANDLRDRVEAGTIGDEEAFSYDLAAATIASADLTVTEIMKVIDGLNDGSITELNADANTRDIARSVEEYVTVASTKAALKELGQTGYDRLAHLMATSAMIDRAVRNYASMRALGKTADTWVDILAMAEEELS